LISLNLPIEKKNELDTKHNQQKHQNASMASTEKRRLDFWFVYVYSELFVHGDQRDTRERLRRAQVYSADSLAVYVYS
jgi:hypothetical protein